ncbi:MAG: GH25 family lysozyme, partial [Ndongobacter sp.]|nr:GH25 family lysozyme [Ndongobacter sp.]
DGEIYYFDAATHEGASGWRWIDARRYHFSDEGRLSRGWTTVSWMPHYFDPADGHAWTGWQTIDGGRYHLNHNGCATRGWATISRLPHYFDPVDGHAWTGVQRIGDKVYLLNHNGAVQKPSGWQTIDEKIYFFEGSEHTAVTGWQWIEAKRYHFSDDGALSRGWTTVSGLLHYFDPADGHAWTGVQRIDGKIYFLNHNGCMQELSGWRTIDGKTYYFDAQTHLAVSGWQWLEGKRLHFEEGGALSRGWTTVSGMPHYFDPTDGHAWTGWQWIDGGRYHLNHNGCASRGWTTISGLKHYFDPVDGHAWTLLQRIDGKTYFLNHNGCVQIGWKTVNGNTYYFDPQTGAARTGQQTIDGKEYFFSSEGISVSGSQSFTGARVITKNGKKYLVGENNEIFPLKGYQVVNGQEYVFLDDYSLAPKGFYRFGDERQGQFKVYYVESEGRVDANTTGALRYGVDISVWNGTQKYDGSYTNENLDFQKIRDSGIHYVIIRAGYGPKEKDDLFEQHYAAAKRAGLQVGAYFYSYAKTVDAARKEAEYMLTLLKGKSFDFPIYFDMEEESQRRLGTAKITAMADAFCSTIQNAGYRAGIYASQSWYEDEYDTSKLTKYSLWIARWDKMMDYNAYPFEQWQYSDQGRLGGSMGPFDMNVTLVNLANLVMNSVIR